MKYAVRFCALIAAVAVAGALGFWIKETVKRGKDFCFSCHAHGNRMVHQEKMETMRKSPPVTLAGVHHLAKTERLSCPDCHRGFDLPGRLRENWLEIKNTLLYFTGSFKEPERVTLTIPNEACVHCHVDNAGKSKEPDYHYYESHKGIRIPSCADCHTAHTMRHDHEFLDRKKVLPICGRCHPDADKTPFTLRSLKLE